MSSANRDYQEYMESLGFATRPWVADPSPQAAPLAAVATEIAPSAPAAMPAPTEDRNEKVWDDLRTTCLACTKCRLSTSRTNVVFGVGNRNARLMFVGEGPGADEDRLGEPFVGKAGQLLTKMIEAMKLTRNDVYIANIVKCRPPDNRNPEPDEIAECIGYLTQQIHLVRPDVIVGLGSIAAKALLATDTGITRLRGKFHALPKFQNREGKEVQFMPTFHPAYLLRNPEAKKPVWEDLKLVMGQLTGSAG